MNMQSQIVQAHTVLTEDFFRQMNGLSVKMSALPRPTLGKLQASARWIWSIESDTSPTDTNFLALWTVLRKDEQGKISGDEYKRRVAATNTTFGAYQHAHFLVENQDEFPEFVAIFEEECEENVLYIHPYVDFLGLVVLDKDGRRFCPSINVNDKKRLCLVWTWLDRGFRPSGRIAVAGELPMVLV